MRSDHRHSPDWWQYPTATIYFAMALGAAGLTGVPYAVGNISISALAAGFFCSLASGTTKTLGELFLSYRLQLLPGGMFEKFACACLYVVNALVAAWLLLGELSGAIISEATLGLLVGGFVYMKTLGPILFDHEIQRIKRDKWAYI